MTSAISNKAAKRIRRLNALRGRLARRAAVAGLAAQPLVENAAAGILARSTGILARAAAAFCRVARNGHDV